MQERIFEPYEQVDSSITSLGGGLGLGLSICQELKSFAVLPISLDILSFDLKILSGTFAILSVSPIPIRTEVTHAYKKIANYLPIHPKNA